jgi:hypothetical protein
MKRRRTWDEFTLMNDRPKFADSRNRTVSRETPEVLSEALGCEDRKQRWDLLRQYRQSHPKRCSLKSWLWLESALMSFDEAIG